MTDTPQRQLSGASETQVTEAAARLRGRLAAALAETPCPDFLSAALSRLQDADGIGPGQMAARLGTDEEGLNRLALCRPPRDEHFAEDVAKIAEYCGGKTSALLSLLRRAQVLATFAEPVLAPEPLTVPRTAARGERFGWLGSSALVAARDANDTNDSVDTDETDDDEGNVLHE